MYNNGDYLLNLYKGRKILLGRNNIMERSKFLKIAGMVTLGGLVSGVSSLTSLARESRFFTSTEPFPVLFFGHGSPMNAIEINEFTEKWKVIGESLPKPHAILCISAHWLSNKGTYVTANEHPKTIHDFGGFPKELFDVQYKAPGSPELAKLTIDTISSTHVHEDMEWGLDHGTWSVLKHVFPQADVPIIQMSIDYSQPASYHYALAKELAALRRKGVLIVTSGNMVHNLRMVAWDKADTDGYGYDWAHEANDLMIKYLAEQNHLALINWEAQGQAFRLAIPTPDHYYPMIYAMALQDKKDELSVFNNKAVMGSLTMTSFRLDAKV